MQKEFFTIDDFALEGKTCLVRPDLNCPYDAKIGKIEDSERIARHAKTILELAQRGAKVVVIAHQGRKGDPDFLPLSQHAALLSTHLKKYVEYCEDLFGSKAVEKIKKMRAGDVVLLENTRFYEEETAKFSEISDYGKTEMVKSLSKVCDFFILDGFSVSHRAQASVVGFAQILPSAAGRVMQKELEGLRNALDNSSHPNIYILGGAKPDDVIGLLEFACKSELVDRILASGVLGELCIAAAGIDLGIEKKKYFEKNGFDKLLPKLSEYVSKYPRKIIMPIDFAYEQNNARKEVDVLDYEKIANGKPSFDLGAKTISNFEKIILQSKTIYFKGPVGVYENPLFEEGTRRVLKAVELADAFKLMGGGHSISAVEKFKIDKSKISHISLAGGAVVEYLQGKKLPGVEALKRAYIRDREKF
ncbi:phosphoglycerate kinase [Candidatus Micrarchaeota archaeon]|nr:phosphoglycerate kinase [Candidatus Micrarchaeota archaeon]